MCTFPPRVPLGPARTYLWKLAPSTGGCSPQTQTPQYLHRHALPQVPQATSLDTLRRGRTGRSWVPPQTQISEFKETAPTHKHVHFPNSPLHGKSHIYINGIEMVLKVIHLDPGLFQIVDKTWKEHTFSLY